MAVKRTISFRDLDGNKIEEDWYFSLGKGDMLEMDIVKDHVDDFATYLKDLEQLKDKWAVIEMWREMLLKAAGQREGKLLVKTPEISRKFRYGGAYEQILTDIFDMEDGGAEFFNSMMPLDVQEQLEKEKNKTHTKDELLNMTDEEFYRVAGTDIREMTKEHRMIAYQRKNEAA